MAYRTGPEEVRQILPGLAEGTDLDPYIKAANLSVTDKLSGVGHSDELLAEIERWLAAHFYAVIDKKYRVSEEKIDVASKKYISMSMGKDGLDMTPYGKQVKLLDTSGSFASDKVFNFNVYGPTHPDITNSTTSE